MELLAEATAFDILILFLFLAFLVRGIWVGFIRQISSLFAMLGGFFLAGYFDNDFYRVLLPYFKSSHTVFLLSYLILFVAFFFLIKLIGLGLKKVMDLTLTTWFDRTVGGIFGVIKGLFFCSLIFLVMTSYLSGSNRYLKESLSYPFLSQSSKAILAFIRDHDLRSYFLPKEPAITIPTLEKSPADAAEPAEKKAAEPEKESGAGEDETKKRKLLF